MNCLRFVDGFPLPILRFLVSYNISGSFQVSMDVKKKGDVKENGILSIVIKDGVIVAFNNDYHVVHIIEKDAQVWKTYSFADKYCNNALIKLLDNKSLHFDLYQKVTSSSMYCDFYGRGTHGDSDLAYSFDITTGEIIAAATYLPVTEEVMKVLGLPGNNKKTPCLLKELASGSVMAMVNDQTLLVWQRKLSSSNKNPKGLVLEGSVLPTHSPVSAFTISDDGSIIAVGTVDGRVLLYEKNENNFDWWGNYSLKPCGQDAGYDWRNFVGCECW
jgi:WD40 repeat protein